MRKKENSEEYYKKLNHFIIKVALLIYISSSMVGIVQYFKGTVSTARLSIMVFTIIAMSVGGPYLLKKNPGTNKIAWLFIILFEMVYISTAIQSQIPETLIMFFPAAILTVLFRDKVITLFQIACTAAGVIIFAVNNFENGAIIELVIITLVICVFAPIMAFAGKFLRDLNNSVEENINEINTQKYKLENMISELKSISDDVKSGSEDLKEIVNQFGESTLTVNKSIDEIAKGAEDTANRIQNETELIDTIKDKIVQASESTKNVKNYSDEADKAVENGTQAMELLTKKSSNINTKNNQVSLTMKELVKKSSSIANITNVITEISERTNLLALNASIEAARAGDSGKGFLVVAEEIKKLAEESKTNVSSIDKILRELERDTSESMIKVEELVKETKEQDLLVNNTTESFKKIESIMNVVKNEAEGVFEEMKVVLELSEEIQESIVALSAISEETLASSEESMAISVENLEKIQSLTNISEKINTSMDELEKYFK